MNSMPIFRYPYTAKDSDCKLNTNNMHVFLASYHSLSRQAENVAQALMNYGPLSVALNAQGLQMYKSGIYDPLLCNPLAIDHAVNIVGFGQEDVHNKVAVDENGGAVVAKGEGEPTKFWVVRNSWGEAWGEKGHFRIKQGKCGIQSLVSSAIVEEKLADDDEDKAVFV